MSLRIIFRVFNENEDGIRFYVSKSPLDMENLPSPTAETGPSSSLTDESEEYGDNAVSYKLPWDVTESAYIKVSAYEEDTELASRHWKYEPIVDEFYNVHIGDYIGGGIYAGINTESDGTKYHIVFALQEGELEASSSSMWKTVNGTTPGTDSESDGWDNTRAIRLQDVDIHPAASYCLDYRGGGHDDWYLPARTELALEANLRGHEELGYTETYRWTSTQTSSMHAVVIRFSDGESFSSTKTHTQRRVRPVRRVPVQG